MRPTLPTALRTFTLLCLALGLLAACTTVPEMCGERPAKGGPPVLRTRQQELCESVRIRVLQYLEHHPVMSDDDYDTLRRRSKAWLGADSTDDLAQRLRDDEGPELAALVADVIRRSSERSRLPLEGEGDADMLVARAAGHGAALAVRQGAQLVAPGMQIDAIFGGGGE